MKHLKLTQMATVLLLAAMLMVAPSVNAQDGESEKSLPAVWVSMGFNDPKEVSSYEVLTSESTETDVKGMNGVYVVTDSVYINYRMSVEGTAYIVIVDDAALYANKGITVTEGNTLYMPWLIFGRLDLCG